MAGKKGATAEAEVRSKDLLRQTYDIATQRLREARHEEFVKYRLEAAQELGVEWSPRLTPEQKAEREFDMLLEQFPHLADKLVAERVPDA